MAWVVLQLASTGHMQKTYVCSFLIGMRLLLVLMLSRTLELYHARAC